MKKIMIFSICLLVLASAIVFAGGQDEKTGDDVYVLKYAGVLPYEHPLSKAIEIWATDLEKKSAGRIKIQLYHGGSLGKTTEVVEYLQQGIVGFAGASTAFLSSFDPKFDVFSLPYVFRDRDHMYKALNSDFGDYMKSLILDDGIRILSFPDSGSRSVYTKDVPVYTPADMKGIKIRVMSQVAVKTMNALGANGVPIPWGELYTSLQTGVVDAAENNPPSIIAGKHYEVCNYYSLTGHFRTPDAFLISEKVYQELPEDLQVILQDSIKNVFMPTQIRLFSESTEASFAKIKEFGMEINEIPDLTPFMELTAPVREEVAKKIGMFDWLKKIAEM